MAHSSFLQEPTGGEGWGQRSPAPAPHQAQPGRCAPSACGCPAPPSGLIRHRLAPATREPCGGVGWGGLHSQDPSCSSRKLICSLRESMRSSCWKEWTSRLPGSGSPRSSAREARLCSGASTSCSFCGQAEGPAGGGAVHPGASPHPLCHEALRQGTQTPGPWTGTGLRPDRHSRR